MPPLNQLSATLVIMACSATKLEHAARAIDLYRGVMYSTFRANVRATSAPAVMILSALHGFIAPDTIIEPYDQLMTPARADLMLGELDRFMPTAWPAPARSILFAGGRNYRRVMNAGLARQVELGHLPAGALVLETGGSIGYQRQQLGAFLRGEHL
ncbi:MULTISPECIES: DUF6884 domain-containing protein [Burkholderia cepacia complex]|uniref:DUF6884 domain-containing protein n=1 Tax=Burkholderia cepacia complex TaxID=87882 RepID=UPI001CF4560B|nr:MULTISPECIES: DUF6884 domain-containing protein [Burkholderia cepacia complex]MCA8081386.1 hypothetical protein [Burkholderia cepacia]